MAELQIASTTAEMMAMFQMASGIDMPEGTLPDIDPLVAVPFLQGSKGMNDQITLSIGEEVLDNFKSGTVGICILAMYESRALFAPDREGQDNDNKKPVCSSQWYPANDKADQVGIWQSKDFDDVKPKEREDGCIECATCPFNQWGSVGSWTGKEGKGKACGSPMHLFVVLTQEVSRGKLEGGRPIVLHKVSYQDPVLLHLSATSLSMVRKFGANVVGMKPIFIKAGLPIPHPEFLPQTLVQKCEKEGQMKWSTFTVEGGNILCHASEIARVAEIAKQIPDLVASKLRIKAVNDPNKTEDGKPIPF
jgi:hypothetical protein